MENNEINSIDHEALKYAKMQSKLSIKRTMMAAERTLMSYISTAMVFISLAVGFIKLYNTFDVFSIVFFCMSGVFLIFGVVDYIITKRSVSTFNDDLDN